MFPSFSRHPRFKNTSHPKVDFSRERYLADTRGDGEALSSGGSRVLGSGTKTTLGKASPQLAQVLATSQGAVGIEDGVTGRDKGGRAGLEGEAVEDELEGEELAVGGHALAVKGREVGVVLAVLVDEVPEDLVEDGGPGGAGGVDLVLGVDRLVRERVGGQASRVGVLADALGVVVGPGAHGVVGGAGVAGLEADGRGIEVAPALAHAASLDAGQAAGVGRATGETGGHW